MSPSDSGFDSRYHLAYGDVQINSRVEPSWIEVVVKQSKCDQFGSGVTLSVGATHSDLCPVAAMLGYLVQCGSAPGPLFTLDDGRLLTRDRFVSAMRTTLTNGSIDPSQYAGHSFRVEAATTAALQGLQDS